MANNSGDASQRSSINSNNNGTGSKDTEIMVANNDHPTATVSHSIPPSHSRSNSTIVTTSPAEAAGSSSSEKDPESGLPVVQEKTADEILAQTVETLPLRQLLPAFFG
jgi:hypothetical protein